MGRAWGGGSPEGPYLLWASVSSCPQPAVQAGAASLRLGTPVNLHLYWRLLFPGPGGGGWPPWSAEEEVERRGLQPCAARAREVAGGLGLPGRGTVAQKVLWAQGRPRQPAGPPSQPLANVSWELAPPHGPGGKVRGL